MKKSRLISIVLIAALAISTFAVGGSAAVVNETIASVSAEAPLSINEAIPKGNKLQRTDFDNPDSLERWNFNSLYGGQYITHETDENGGYLRMRNISTNWVGFEYIPIFFPETGMYKFTGYFRTAREGEITYLRVKFNEFDGTSTVYHVYCGNEWSKVEFYVNIKESLSSITVLGGPAWYYTQDYCVDNFSFVEVDSIPENAPTVGGEYANVPNFEEVVEQVARGDVKKWDPKAEEKYDVQGIVINYDNSAYLRQIGSNPHATYDDIKNFAKSFEGSHVTDFVMCVNADIATYPSKVMTDYIDKYNATEELGQAVDYKEADTAIKGAYKIFNTMGTDYIGMWHEVFTEIGINPWISFRMNDIHDKTGFLNNGTPHFGLSEFLYNNPNFVRVHHHNGYNGYDVAYNYTYPEVREYFLAFINEALNRYDTYGIELDFQREIYLWHIGGEYNGLDILNDFMRQIDDLVDVYEEKYGHEIKIAVRVAPDIQQNYELGLDVLTWAMEGIIDRVIASSRFETSYTDIPTRLWKSVLEPLGIEFAVNIETNNMRVWEGSASGGHSLETFAGLAANAFSQGADKIYMFNFFADFDGINEEDKVSTKIAYAPLTDGEWYWNVITTIGSYDKLMELDRRTILNYNDIAVPWKHFDRLLPASVNKNAITTLRIPVGDVADGSKLAVRFSTDNTLIANNPPQVYVNSKLCTFEALQNCDGYYTANKVLSYEIPEEVYGDTYMVVEIMSDASFTIDYAEIFVDAK